EHHATFVLGRQPRLDLPPPPVTDLVGAVATDAEVIAGQLGPSPALMLHHAADPAEILGIPRAVGDAVADKADSHGSSIVPAGSAAPQSRSSLRLLHPMSGSGEPPSQRKKSERRHR